MVAAEDVEWYSELQESSNQFFSYQLGILVEGKRLVLFFNRASITKIQCRRIRCLPDNQEVALPLTDGRALRLPLERIKPLIRLLLQLGIRHLDEEQQLLI